MRKTISSPATFLYKILLPFSGLKFVEIDNNNLYISNIFKEIKVNKFDIEDVYQNSFTSYSVIWIHFKYPTVFGTEITFIPKMTLFTLNGLHPTVYELRKFADIEPSGKDNSSSR